MKNETYKNELRYINKPKNKENDMNNISVSINDVSLMYNLSREREERLKEYVINMVKGKLYFDPFWALQNVTFSLMPGDSLGIVGQNGAGKSSLLKIVSGIIQPTKGKVYTKGVIAPMVELGGGFDTNMTAKQNIYFMGAMHGFPKKYMQERYENIIKFAELEEFSDVAVKKLSSGMTSKLAFALATLVNPDIVIADEALAVGDMNFRLKCEKRLNEIVEKGATILFVSHSLEQVQKVCKKALWLEHGKMMFYGDSREVCDAYRQFMIDKRTITE